MKNKIHYVLILDSSGSMQDLKQEVITSFNEQVEMIMKMSKSKKGTQIKLTLCVFNDIVDFKFVDQSIDLVQRLTDNDYKPDSMTALYDAIGASFLKISEIVTPSEKVFFAIFTDGLENASKHYTAEDVSFKISESERKGWQIQFFCRYAERSHYKSKFSLKDKNVVGISMDADGFSVMEKHAQFCLMNMADDLDDMDDIISDSTNAANLVQK
jgi:hypothetical protein